MPATGHRAPGGGPALRLHLDRVLGAEDYAVAQASCAAPDTSETAAGAAAQVAPRDWFGRGVRWARWSKMTGDWNRFRTKLQTRGITIDTNHIGDFSGLPRGAVGSRVVGRALTLIDVGIDLQKTAGLPGGRLLVQYQRKGGANGADSAGDAQGFSNIDADDFSRIGELWYEQ